LERSWVFRLSEWDTENVKKQTLETCSPNGNRLPFVATYPQTNEGFEIGVCYRKTNRELKGLVRIG